MTGHSLNLRDAMEHIVHLSSGVRYQRGCGYCGMRIKACWSRAAKSYSLNKEVREDIDFYNDAQDSGKYRIDF